MLSYFPIQIVIKRFSFLKRGHFSCCVSVDINQVFVCKCLLWTILLAYFIILQPYYTVLLTKIYLKILVLSRAGIMFAVFILMNNCVAHMIQNLVFRRTCTGNVIKIGLNLQFILKNIDMPTILNLLIQEHGIPIGSALPLLQAIHIFTQVCLRYSVS